MKRMDVDALAKKLSLESHINSDIIYCFLMKCGKALCKNPCVLDWGVSNNYIWLNGQEDSFRLGGTPKNNNFNSHDHCNLLCDYELDDYELLIAYDSEY